MEAERDDHSEGFPPAVKSLLAVMGGLFLAAETTHGLGDIPSSVVAGIGALMVWTGLTEMEQS